MKSEVIDDELPPSIGGVGERVRVLTWNINGLRKVAASHGGLKALLDQFHADILEHSLAQAEGYHGLFSHCKLRRKQSYSGVATFVRSDSLLRTPASTTSLSDTEFFGTPAGCGLSSERLVEMDVEGRVVVTDHEHFLLFNIYAPCISSCEEDEKMDERKSFKRDFLSLLQSRILEAEALGRNVILVGDLNACATQMDHGFTMTDKEFYGSAWSRWIRGLLELDSADSPRLLDCFRKKHPERKDAYTCWNTVTGARENNYGTRIDYVIANAAFAGDSLLECDIMPDFSGSDHCPVCAAFLVPRRSPAHDRGLGGSAVSSLEHPPACSCFFRELLGKQATLSTYFAAADVHGTGSAMEEDNASDGSQSQGTGFTSTGTMRSHGCSLGSTGNRTPNRKERSRFKGSTASNTQGKMGRGREVGQRTRQSTLEFSGRACQQAKKASCPDVNGSRESAAQQPSGDVPSALGVSDAMTLPGRAASSPEAVGRSQRPISNEEPSRNGEHEREAREAHSGKTVRDSIGTTDDSGWAAIFGTKKSTPLCAHGEPSIQRTVLKQGANHNRRFYTCARAAGNWPLDRNARCEFFQWRLDGVRGYKKRPPRDENVKKRRRA